MIGLKSHQAEPSMNSTPVRTCIHVFTSGHRCNAIALRDSPKCYHHHGHRRRLKRSRISVDLDTPAGRLAAISRVTHAILNEQVDPEVARSMLYSISLAGRQKPKG
jgi:hypothetical protein